jgi:hypothetical protein
VDYYEARFSALDSMVPTQSTHGVCVLTAEHREAGGLVNEPLLEEPRRVGLGVEQLEATQALGRREEEPLRVSCALDRRRQPLDRIRQERDDEGAQTNGNSPSPRRVSERAGSFADT